MWGIYPACGVPDAEAIFQPVPEVVQGDLFGVSGTLAQVQEDLPTISEVRRRLVPNLYGEFAIDYRKFDTGVPTLRGELVALPIEDPSVAVPLFPSLSYHIGPDFILTENVMNE